MMRRCYLICALALVALLLPASVFAAEECTTDADCDDGFSCESYESTCVDSPCPEGETCTDECESTTHYECVPEPPDECDTVADCSGDLVCVTYTWEECPDVAVACPADAGECDPAQDTSGSCTTETEGYCLPPYLAPCDTDSDCGAGFSCVERESCACSGSGSTGEGSIGEGSTGGDSDDSYVDAGSEADGSDDSCSCAPTGDFYCELDVQECTSDADCPGDLICDASPYGSVESCWTDSDGNTTCESSGEDGISPESDYCQPADLERWVGVGGSVGSDESGGSYSPGGDQSTSGSESVDRGADDSANDGSGGSGSQSAGCTTGGAAPVSGAFAFMLLAVAGIFGRRRRS